MSKLWSGFRPALSVTEDVPRPNDALPYAGRLAVADGSTTNLAIDRERPRLIFDITKAGRDGCRLDVATVSRFEGSPLVLVEVGSSHSNQKIARLIFISRSPGRIDDDTKLLTHSVTKAMEVTYGARNESSFFSSITNRQGSLPFELSAMELQKIRIAPRPGEALDLSHVRILALDRCTLDGSGSGVECTLRMRGVRIDVIWGSSISRIDFSGGSKIGIDAGHPKDATTFYDCNLQSALIATPRRSAAFSAFHYCDLQGADLRDMHHGGTTARSKVLAMFYGSKFDEKSILPSSSADQKAILLRAFDPGNRVGPLWEHTTGKEVTRQTDGVLKDAAVAAWIDGELLAHLQANVLRIPLPPKILGWK